MSHKKDARLIYEFRNDSTSTFEVLLKIRPKCTGDQSYHCHIIYGGQTNVIYLRDWARDDAKSKAILFRGRYKGIAAISVILTLALLFRLPTKSSREIRL